MEKPVIEVNDTNFDSEVVKSEQPVLLDFSAEWCGPCKKLEPVVTELAKQYEGKLKVGHVDVEQSPNTAAQFGVMSVPTLIFFRNGAPAHQVIGAVSRQALEQAIRKVIV